MGLQECGLNLNKNKLELQPHGTLDFPCSAYQAYHAVRSEDIVPWHWHEDVEVIRLCSGQLKVKVPGKTLHLKQGDMIFINSNIMHYAEAEKRCEIQSLIFHPTLITGHDKTIYAQKYIIPLINCTELASFHITHTFDWETQMTKNFNHAFEAMKFEPLGYEFIVRENLSHLCLKLYEQNNKKIESGFAVRNQDRIRIHKMLDYIHEKYSENLTLAQIAKSADVGERECLRCFQREIQISPMQYLIKYRITLAATLLLQTPNSSISEISIQCGFDSPSNFSQLFKRYHQCTPRTYRKNLQNKNP